MTLVTVGSGLGGFTAVAPQPEYGGEFVTPTRTPPFKSNKATYDPHVVQGGPYLAGGRLVDIGSAHVQVYRDAKGTIAGDMMSTGAALLLAAALGSGAKLEELAMSGAYELGGASGVVLSTPAKNIGDGSAACFDMQIGTPTDDGTVHPVNLHSCIITKAEWVFDRTGVVTFSYEYDSQFVELETALISPTFTTGPVPFTMASAASEFLAGPYGEEAAVDGIRKATITVEHKLDTSRMYLGSEHKKTPVANALIDISVSLETDYTVQAKALYDTFLENESRSLICNAVGGEISSEHNNTFAMQVSDAFLESGGEAGLDGPDLIKNTLSWKGKIDGSNHSALTATLITADSTF
ncbi:MAG TPA: phage tail tube protein [Solirubrobacteraceae bacterium]|jgi:hypothetical protein